MIEPRRAILLLLSDPRLRDIYLSRFERAGWAAEDALHLKDAERRAVQLRPAVFLLDSKFLDDTRTTLKHLGSLPSMLKTKLVILARQLSREQIHELLSAGADEVILSGHLTPQALVNRLETLIA